jgi:ribosomal protein S6--L-glutamate ligase
MRSGVRNMAGWSVTTTPDSPNGRLGAGRPEDDVRLCFLIEEQYRHDSMPMNVVGQLTAWGHRVDVLRPGSSLIRLSDTVRAGTHDAWVLKTVSGGPGLTLLEAAAGAGLTTVNDVRSIRLVRDKVLASVLAERAGLPVPATYSAAGPELLAQVPAADFPLVVKPAGGSSGRGVCLVAAPEELAAAGPELSGEGPLIAQPYVPNSGADLKVYCVGGEQYATLRCSPLHPGAAVRERAVPLPAEVARLVTEVGAVFGLDLYGVDVLLGPDGPVIVDINDFPSFRQVPDAVRRVARAVLDLARADGCASPEGVVSPPAARVPAPAPSPLSPSHPASPSSPAGVGGLPTAVRRPGA